MLENIAVKRLVKIYGFAESEAKNLVKSYAESGKYTELCDFLKVKSDTSKEVLNEF